MKDCPPAKTGYACDYARHKRDAPCGICPLKGRTLTAEESESLRIAAVKADEKPDGQAENAKRIHATD